jgi:hypothetical protein
MHNGSFRILGVWADLIVLQLWVEQVTGGRRTSHFAVRCFYGVLASTLGLRETWVIAMQANRCLPSRTRLAVVFLMAGCRSFTGSCILFVHRLLGWETVGGIYAKVGDIV